MSSNISSAERQSYLLTPLVAVVDPSTGKYIFSQIGRKTTILQAKKEMEPVQHAVTSLEVTVEQGTSPLVPAIDVDIHTASLSTKSTHSYRPTPRGFKRARRTVLLAFKVGEVFITRGIIGPIVRNVRHEWKTLQAFRARQRKNRRSKTLDWMERRARAQREAAEM